ncbi:hypothetical protein DJ84_11065, partial [Halorubrum ezzemoulense]
STRLVTAALAVVAVGALLVGLSLAGAAATSAGTADGGAAALSGIGGPVADGAAVRRPRARGRGAGEREADEQRSNRDDGERGGHEPRRPTHWSPPPDRWEGLVARSDRSYRGASGRVIRCCQGPAA